MNDWNIQSRAHACQTCELPFSDQQPYHTLLLEEKTEFRRIDVCEACWKSRFNQGAEEQNVVSKWQGIYEAPPAAPPDAIQKDTAETLLRKLVEQNDPAHGAACFILAVMLERKRLLKVKEQIKREDGTRLFIYEQPKTGDIFTIADPELQLNQLDAVQRDVAQLLEHGLNPPVPPAPAQSSTPAETSPEPTVAPVEPVAT